jgi:replicative DNA helicase
MVYSPEIERMVLAGLIQYPETYPDVAVYLNDKDFHSEVYRTIFTVIRIILNESKVLDRVLIGTYISNANIKFKEDVDVNGHLEALSLMQVTQEATVSAVRELKKVTARRVFYETGQKLQKYAKESGNDDFTTILTNCDSLYSKTSLAFSTGIEPTDLYSDMRDYVEGLGNNPTEGYIIPPYKNFYNLFGDLDPGHLMVAAARAKCGKSTFLMDMLNGICVHNPSTPNAYGLILDTELDKRMVQRRMAAALSGVPEFFIKNGSFRKNAEMLRKVRAIWPMVERYFGKIEHVYCAGADIETVISIIRRWYFKTIKPYPERKGIFAYDYLKIGSSDSIKDAFQTSLTVGRKTDRLKQTATELQIPGIAMCQTNRSNETNESSGNSRNISGTSIGLSDQINQFSSSVYLLVKKSMEERADEGGTATHKLFPLYNRSLGKHGATYSDMVKIIDPNDGTIKWKKNFINFKFDNFQVTELDTYADQVVAMQNGHVHIGNGQPDGTLI